MKGIMMGRRRKDRDSQEARQQLRHELANTDFLATLNQFAADWRARNYPDLDERIFDWDSAQQRYVYSGMYYELRELCDRWHLRWPEAGVLLARYLKRQQEGSEQPIRALDDLPDLPPRHEWEWWRLARTGLGYPRAEEVAKLKAEIGAWRARTAIAGFTVDQIAITEYAVDRTISNAIKRCWRYFMDAPNNVSEIADLAGLRDFEIFALFFVPDVRRNRLSSAYRQRRSHRRQEGSIFEEALRIMKNNMEEPPTPAGEEGAKSEK